MNYKFSLTREMEEYEKEKLENDELYEESKRKWLDLSQNNNNNNNNALQSAEREKKSRKEICDETDSVIREVKTKLGQYWDNLDSLINTLPKNINELKLNEEQSKIITDANNHRENAQKYVNDGDQQHYDDDDEL